MFLKNLAEQTGKQKKEGEASKGKACSCRDQLLIMPDRQEQLNVILSFACSKHHFSCEKIGRGNSRVVSVSGLFFRAP